MMTIDVSIVRVALPTIQDELELSDAAQQWIVNAYLLTMGTLAIAGGRAGDRLGRRGVFLGGVVIFIVCSMLGGLAGSGTMLIAARAGQGVGAAIMTPGNTAMVTDAFAGESLGKAMGILVGIGTVGVSVGALVGGLLIEVAGWRSVFFINVPVSLVVIGLVAASVPERRAERAPGLDPAGLLTLLVGMTALTLGLMQAPVWGFGSVATISALAAAALTLAAWLRVESRVPDPLVDPRVLRGAMLGANVVAFCVPFVLSGLSVLFAIYLQNVLGYSALETGALMLPLTVPGLIGSLLEGGLVAHLGSRAVVTGGMAMAAVGVYLVGVGAGSSSDYRALLPGLVLFAFGGGVALPAMTARLMAAARPGGRGMVSGVYNTARTTGATLGLAVMGALLATFESAHLDEEVSAGRLSSVEATRIHNVLAGSKSEAAEGELTRREAVKLKAELRRVFDSAFATTLKLSALVAAFGALVAFFTVPQLRAPPIVERGAGRAALAEA